MIMLNPRYRMGHYPSVLRRGNSFLRRNYNHDRLMRLAENKQG